MSPRPPVVSREDELARLHQFFGPGATTACLTLSGEPGIGKTTLWEAGREVASDLGYLVLSARTSEAEAGLSFAALADLVDAAGSEVLASIPGPQRHALEIALRRAGPVGAAPEPFAISAGFLSLLRALVEQGPLLVALDDVQWLDHASAGALLFAARRLSSWRARFLLSRRTGRPSDLERALQPAGVDCIEVGALSLGAMSRLLSERLGLVLPRRVLRQVYDASQGNPLLALELGRSLAERMPDVGAELPVPDLVDDVFGERLRGLSAPLRRVLLAVSLSAWLTTSELAKVVDPLTVEDAEASGLLLVERSRVRPSHPLLAAAARRHARAAERQELHLQLAAAVDDPGLRARHLAMATMAPDAVLAATLAAAAVVESERGAVQDAEEFAAHALRLTPPESPERAGRLLALGRFHVASGDLPRAAELLTACMGDLPPGRDRALALLILGAAADIPGERAYIAQALVEAGEDPELRAIILARQATLLAVDRVESIEEAEALAEQALTVARGAGAEVEYRVLPALAWARLLRGRPFDELNAVAVPQGSTVPNLYEGSIERPQGVRFAFRGQFDQARPIFARLMALSDQRGEVRSALVLHVQMCELELRAGDVRAAARLLDEVEQWTALEEFTLTRARLQAVRAAVAGEPSEARRLAAQVLATGELSTTSVWDRLEATRAIGLAALFEHDTGGAVSYLRQVWDHTCAQHIDDPGAFPVAADLVEALVTEGDIGTAAEVTKRARLLSEQQAHPWGLATSDRCQAMIQLADGYTDEAGAALGGAATIYGQLGASFDQSRSLLVLGRAQRRSKKRSGARQSLEEAVTLFDQAGCPGWAGQARAELGRVSGRRSVEEDELTPSERRVAELAGGGLSNKEIAARLFVSVYTVEAHLSHAYAKLGVRSRAQLANRLSHPD
jgi:DNA-binding CsgD family transcriptional regulator